MKLFKRKFKNHLKLKDSAPTILTGLGACGVIFTAVAAAHDTPKALKIIEHENNNRKFKAKLYKTETNELLPEYEPVSLTLWEKAKLTWKCYIPTILVGGTTIFCIIKSHELSVKQKKELLAAYALLHATYYEYRNKIENDSEVMTEIAKDHLKNGKIEYGNGKQGEQTIIFVDDFMKTAFESTKEAVLSAEYEMNRTFALRGYVSMGDFYRYLGLDDVYAEPDVGPLLERFGWSYDIGTDMGYEWIDFNHKKIEEEGQPETYEISYPFEPVLGYMY